MGGQVPRTARCRAHAAGTASISAPTHAPWIAERRRGAALGRTHPRLGSDRFAIRLRVRGAARSSAEAFPLEGESSRVRGSGAEKAPEEVPLGRALSLLRAFYRFTRPHTVLGTTISVLSVSSLALGGPGDATPAFARGVLRALAAALCMNVSIVGLNQIFDVEIDRVNKPNLPLASGEFTLRGACAVVAAATVAGFAIAVAGTPPGCSSALLLTLGVSLALGVAYSADLPMLRWKRNPGLAAACILAVRAGLVQVGFFAHAAACVRHGLGLGAGAGWWGLAGAMAGGDPGVRLGFATAMMTALSIAIALVKDCPDVRGDDRAGVRTMSVRLGPKRVLGLTMGWLAVAYVGAAGLGLGVCGPVWAKAATCLGHLGVLAFLRAKARDVDPGDPQSLYAFYMHLWRAFYVEYALVPLFRL